jgi:hypothetical protein
MLREPMTITSKGQMSLSRSPYVFCTWRRMLSTKPIRLVQTADQARADKGETGDDVSHREPAWRGRHHR